MRLSCCDHAELSDLVARYAAAVDAGDGTAVAELFLPDGVLVSPDPPRCLDPVVEQIGPTRIAAALELLSGFDLTVHQVLGTVFDLGPDPNCATGRVSAAAHHVLRRPGAEPGSERIDDLVWNLCYRDEYRRDRGRWRFARREVSVLTVASVPLRSANPA